MVSDELYFGLFVLSSFVSSLLISCFILRSSNHCDFQLCLSTFSVILSLYAPSLIFSFTFSSLSVVICGFSVSCSTLLQLVPVPEAPAERRRRRKRQLVFMDEEIQISQEALQAQINDPRIETRPLVR